MSQRRRDKAPACVYFVRRRNDDGEVQPCVYVECIWSGLLSGPVWGHYGRSVDRALATLTKRCDCPASFHRGVMFEGVRQRAKRRTKS